MKKNIVVVVLLVIAVVAVVALKNKRQGSAGAASCPIGICTLPIPAGRPLSEDPKPPKAVPAPEKLPVLLELGSVNCVPCKMMAPILDELRETFGGKLEVEFIDVWKNEAAGKLHGIRSIPTQVFFDADGNEIFRHEGFFPRDDIVAKWKELGIGLADEPQNKEE